MTSGYQLVCSCCGGIVFFFFFFFFSSRRRHTRSKRDWSSDVCSSDLDVALKEENAAGFDVLRIDLAEAELDLDGVDGIFHLAGQPGVRSFGPVFADYLRRNTLVTQRVFESAGGVKVVYASSSSIYGDAERYPT